MRSGSKFTSYSDRSIVYPEKKDAKNCMKRNCKRLLTMVRPALRKNSIQRAKDFFLD